MYQHWVVGVVRTREGNYSQASGSNIYIKEVRSYQEARYIWICIEYAKDVVGRTNVPRDEWGSLGVSRYQQLFNIDDNDERGFPWSPSLHSTCRAVC